MSSALMVARLCVIFMAETSGSDFYDLRTGALMLRVSPQSRSRSQHMPVSSPRHGHSQEPGFPGNRA